MLYAFDIDGTLVRSFMREGGEAADYDKIEVLPGRREKIERLAAQPGARFALITNQGGVAFGYQLPAQVFRKIGLIAAEFRFFHGRPFSVHIAFHHPKATVKEWRCVEGGDYAEYRKPGPGMLVEAIGRHKADTSTTWYVGDLDSDALAASRAGVRYIDAEEFFR